MVHTSRPTDAVHPSSVVTQNNNNIKLISENIIKIATYLNEASLFCFCFFHAIKTRNLQLLRTTVVVIIVTASVSS